MTTLTDKRILVAGGTASVGGHLVDGVLAADATAIVLSRSQEKLDALVQGRDEVHSGRLVPLLGTSPTRGRRAP
jgi:FlaA1/EpsC-like NDP-sugar epimerase